MPNSKHLPLHSPASSILFFSSIGDNIRLLLERPDGLYTFRLHRERVYYCSEAMIKYASNFPRKELLSFGTCFGRFTKTRKFRLHITALDFVAPYAKVNNSDSPVSSSFLFLLVQSLAETQCRTAISLWPQCGQNRSWTYH